MQYGEQEKMGTKLVHKIEVIVKNQHGKIAIRNVLY